MNLLFDIGNSCVKWKVYSSGLERRSGRFAYQIGTLREQLASSFSGVFLSLSSVHVSNVAGDSVNAIISLWASEEFGVAPQFAISVIQKCGLISAYIQPEELGVDRFLAMIGARVLTKKAIVVVDCGTATTIDSVTSRGKFIGGVILPSVDLMCGSLANNASALMVPQGEQPISIFSTDTQSAIFSGAVFATVGVVERAVNRLSKLTDSEVSCIVTGGNGSVVLPHLDVSSEYHPDLVFKGLSEYFHMK